MRRLMRFMRLMRLMRFMQFMQFKRFMRISLANLILTLLKNVDGHKLGFDQQNAFVTAGNFNRLRKCAPEKIP